jgi:hypothetical protein
LTKANLFALSGALGIPFGALGQLTLASSFARFFFLCFSGSLALDNLVGQALKICPRISQVISKERKLTERGRKYI